jgi:hypothetical protein
MKDPVSYLKTPGTRKQTLERTLISRVATVRFSSGSGTFWPNLNLDLGSGSGCNQTLNLRFSVRTRFGLDLFPFLEISQSETDPSSLRPSLEVQLRKFPEPKP